jgi:hypothetical protein
MGEIVTGTEAEPEHNRTGTARPISPSLPHQGEVSTEAALASAADEVQEPRPTASRVLLSYMQAALSRSAADGSHNGGG